MTNFQVKESYISGKAIFREITICAWYVLIWVNLNFTSLTIFWVTELLGAYRILPLTRGFICRHKMRVMASPFSCSNQLLQKAAANKFSCQKVILATTECWTVNRYPTCDSPIKIQITQNKTFYYSLETTSFLAKMRNFSNKQPSHSFDYTIKKLLLKVIYVLFHIPATQY